MLMYGRNQHSTVKQLFPIWGKKSESCRSSHSLCSLHSFGDNPDTKVVFSLILFEFKSDILSLDNRFFWSLENFGNRKLEMGNEKRDCYLSSSCPTFYKRNPNTVVLVLGEGKRCWIRKTFAIVKISALFLITRYFWLMGKIGLSYRSLERFPLLLLLAVNSIPSPCALRGSCSLENTRGQWGSQHNFFPSISPGTLLFS